MYLQIKNYNIVESGYLRSGKMISLLEDITSIQTFSLKTKAVNFDFSTMAQGSVLSPILVNLYTSDLAPTNSRKFIYADDLAMAYQHQNFENVENGLSDYLIPLNKYFTK
jgi:hypothetical protein